jgi:hypothetical protein
LYQSRLVRYPSRPLALATSKSSQTMPHLCSGSPTREETKRKESLFDMEFSQPQRRNRVRGLTRGLGRIKNLNFLGGSEAPQRGSADVRTDRKSHAFAGPNSEQKRGFRLTSRAASEFRLAHSQQKTQRVPSKPAAKAVTTKPDGGSGRILHLLGL